MNEAMSKLLQLPKGIATARARPRPTVEIPNGVHELPLVDKDMPADKQIQEVWNAKVGTFDLSDDTQAEAYRIAWQKITDGHAISCESKVDFHQGRYIAYLRWAEFTYTLPQS